jgi:hypothetical protein
VANSARPGRASSTPTGSWSRWAGLAGAPAVVIGFVAGSLADHGGKGLDPTMTAEELVEPFARLAGQARLSAVLLGVTAVFSLVFLGALWERMNRRSGWLAVIAVAAGIVGVAGTLDWAAWMLAAAVAGEVGDGHTARTVMALEWGGARTAVPLGFAMTAAAAVAGLRDGTFPRWFSLLSAAFAVVLALGLLPVGPAGLTGIFGGLWTLIAAGVLAFAGDPANYSVRGGPGDARV